MTIEIDTLVCIQITISSQYHIYAIQCASPVVTKRSWFSSPIPHDLNLSSGTASLEMIIQHQPPIRSTAGALQQTQLLIMHSQKLIMQPWVVNPEKATISLTSSKQYLIH